ncbi:cytochrome b [Moraxella sp. ZY200743]|uniref:cytochrome b n=1 Tax=Moraxella sp. ZY200743 TaxID=2911970 RepID=UPI003D7D068D
MSNIHDATNTNSTQKYALLVRVFHWIGALLILVAFIAINQGDEFVGLHKSIGASFLLWTILRILTRFVTTAPSPVSAPAWQKTIAHLTHVALYVVMLAMPISGVLMSMYGGRGVSVFGLFDLPTIVSINPSMAKLMNLWHTQLIWLVMWLLIVMHIGAALYHQFVIKDGLLNRMR